MKLEFVPLLQIQRDFYTLPSGQERFRIYLETLLTTDASDVELFPLVMMNPMGKDHIPAVLDTLLEIDADTVAASTIADISAQFKENSDAFKLGLVIVDDVKGGWTNRYTLEFTVRFEVERSLKRGWLSVILWASEVPSKQKVQEETLSTVYRTAYIQQHGVAHTLQDMLYQEGYAMAMAGCQHPDLELDDLAYTSEVIAPYLLTRDYPTILTCLFGDRAAQSLGYAPQGLSDRAGLALALYQAQHNIGRNLREGKAI